MTQAIGQVLAFGAGVALSPIPIVGVVLMLGTPRGRGNGTAFLLGWLGGLALVGAIVLLASGGAEASKGGQPADWVNILKLVLGFVLFRVALRQWCKRPGPGEEPELPGWMRTIDRFTAPRSAAFGFALAAINPKNLILTVGAAAAIAQTGVEAGEQAIAFLAFVIVATLGVGVPILAYLLTGERSRRLLDELKGWMAANNATIMTVICVLLGAKLIGDGIAGF